MIVFGNFKIFLDVESSGSNPFEMKKNWQGVLWASLILVLTIGLLMEVMAQHLQLMVKHKRRQGFLGHKMMPTDEIRFNWLTRKYNDQAL